MRKFAATKKVRGSLTRTADTNAYAAGDVIANATSSGEPNITFENVAAAETNGKGYITNAILICSGLAATPGDLELWVFDAAIASQNDNAAFAPSDAELTNGLLGVLSFTTEKDTANNRVYIADAAELPIQFVCEGDSVRDLYGVLVVRNAMSGVSAEVFTVVLDIDLNELA